MSDILETLLQAIQGEVQRTGTQLAGMMPGVFGEPEPQFTEEALMELIQGAPREAPHIPTIAEALPGEHIPGRAAPEDIFRALGDEITRGGETPRQGGFSRTNISPELLAERLGIVEGEGGRAIQELNSALSQTNDPKERAAILDKIDSMRSDSQNRAREESDAKAAARLVTADNPEKFLIAMEQLARTTGQSPEEVADRAGGVSDLDYENQMFDFLGWLSDGDQRRPLPAPFNFGTNPFSHMNKRKPTEESRKKVESFAKRIPAILQQFLGEDIRPSKDDIKNILKRQLQQGGASESDIELLLSGI